MGAGLLSQYIENRGWAAGEAWFDFHQVYPLNNTQICF